MELAEALPLRSERPAPSEELRLVDTPDAKTIQDLVEQFEQPIERTVKTLVVAASDEIEADLVALLVRGDHELNAVKAEKLPQVAGTAAHGHRRGDPRRHRCRSRLPRAR